jgi:tetratricopeptide (TPR) repeat protein
MSSEMLLPRRLIPKWRTIATTLESAEAGSHKSAATTKPQGDAEELQRSIANWREERTPGFLGDVLAHSIHKELIPQVLDVSLEARRRGDPMTVVQSTIIEELLATSGEALIAQGSAEATVQAKHPYQAGIQRLRALLSSNPNNALAWLDLAQFQAAQGKTKGAERSILSALNLAPDNRTVIRTAARFWVHANQHDLAHQLVRRHQRTTNDPWLMASEIALADLAGVPSVFLTKGKRFIVDNAKFNPAHLTELSGVIADEEFKAGQLKRAREAFRKALQLPNDNMIAQAIQHQARFGVVLESPQINQALARSHEAQVIKAWSDREPDLAERHGKAWHNEEPFSSRPIQFLSSLYLFKGEYENSERWIKVGLGADPSDRGLLINLAFLHARAGRGSDMTSVLRRLRNAHGDANPFAKATEGLFEYSQGRFENGDHLYNEAVEEFTKTRRPALAAYGRLFQTLYAYDFGNPKAEEIARRAKQPLEEHWTPDVRMFLHLRTQSILTAHTLEHEKDLGLRRMSQLVYDPLNNTLTVKEGITARGAKPVVIKGVSD